ncbi:HNH endonuclease signature motif containing protein [Microbacterium sp. YY-03]|uniref:HNH endonuclease signature motif containing protein n=1 Tax=Microbacterium sp. YY-03 TaxID=3421636 RepID=UPI003D186671
MALFHDVLALIPTAVSHAGASVAPEADRSIITDVVGDFSRDEVMAAIREVTAVTQEAEYIRSVLIGMAASLSTREAGHEGLAQKEGHRNTTSLIQAVIGTSYTEAAKQVRVGESLVESLVSPPAAPASEPAGGGDSPEGDAGPDPEPVPCREPWHAPLGRALRDQQLTTQQHDSIMKGLGAPPRIARDSHGDPVPESSGSPAPGADDAPDAGVEPRALTREEADEVDREFIDAWSLAAETLVEEAAIRDTTELYRAAKALRDQLDPVGAEKRYQERYEKRSFRIEQWRDDVNLDREQRLFSAQQRIALALRDGGRRWLDCDRPASYCEAHHIDPWKECGKTDIDRGVLLCHFNHRQLHLDKTRITRAGTDDFVLRRPGRPPEVLPRRAALTYAWASLHHPPRRFRPDPPPRT